MRERIKEVIEKLDDLSKAKQIKIVSHHDTDGITSAAIFARAMQRWHKKFDLEIVKNLEQEYIERLPEDKILIFLDLASGSLPYLGKKKTEVVIIDHHELPQEKIPDNIMMINPRLFNEENISGAGLCYLFAKTLSHQNTDLATLATIGMIGDQMEKNVSKTFNEIIQDAEVTVRRGLCLYPATRPLDKVLQYSSSIYIPGVTGSFSGTLSVLKESNIGKTSSNYKSLAELTEEEMSSLITAIMLRRVGEDIKADDLIGNLYLVKFFNKMEDARELSALINACSRMDQPYISLGFCLGNAEAKKAAEKIYIDYKQSISAALRYIEENDKITGKDYMIINARDKIKDTIIGTAASIISHSPLCSEGTIIVGMAYNEDKIKVSCRLSGKKGRNVREVLAQAASSITAEVGGHPEAAGCLISKEHEEIFTESLKKVLDVGLVKI